METYRRAGRIARVAVLGGSLAVGVAGCEKAKQYLPGFAKVGGEQSTSNSVTKPKAEKQEQALPETRPASVTAVAAPSETCELNAVKDFVADSASNASTLRTVWNLGPHCAQTGVTPSPEELSCRHAMHALIQSDVNGELADQDKRDTEMYDLGVCAKPAGSCGTAVSALRKGGSFPFIKPESPTANESDSVNNSNSDADTEASGYSARSRPLNSAWPARSRTSLSDKLFRDFSERMEKIFRRAALGAVTLLAAGCGPHEQKHPETFDQSVAQCENAAEKILARKTFIVGQKKIQMEAHYFPCWDDFRRHDVRLKNNTVPVRIFDRAVMDFLYGADGYVMKKHPTLTNDHFDPERNGTIWLREESTEENDRD